MWRHFSFIGMPILATMFSLISPQSWGQTSAANKSISNRELFATELAMTGFSAQAKESLLVLIKEYRGTPEEGRIRYLLGCICYFKDLDTSCAMFHWVQLMENDYNSPEAERVRGFLNSITFTNQMVSEQIHEEAVEKLDDYFFAKEMKRALVYWNPQPPTFNINRKAHLRRDLALEFFERLLKRYHRPDQKVKIFWGQFLVEAGFHNYSDSAGIPLLPNYKRCRELADSLLAYKEGQELYIASQFLLGQVTSGTVLFAPGVKLNHISMQYFEEVLRMTEKDPLNIYGFWARIWLNR